MGESEIRRSNRSVEFMGVDLSGAISYSYTRCAFVPRALYDAEWIRRGGSPRASADFLLLICLGLVY